jgi:hypothetical protein
LLKKGWGRWELLRALALRWRVSWCYYRQQQFELQDCDQAPLLETAALFNSPTLFLGVLVTAIADV